MKLPDDIIEARIHELRTKTGIRLSMLNSYQDLSEKEKIPYRVMSAEILALEELLKGENLDQYLEDCVQNEYYCGAEGIKKAKEWIKSLQNK